MDVLAQLARAGSAPAAPERTALERHMDFFDVNKDRRLDPGEVFQAIRELGFSRALAAIGTAFVFSVMPSRNVDELAKTVRHKDSGTFRAADGSFDEARFRAWFEATDKDGSGTLTRSELLHATLAISDAPLNVFLSTIELQPMYTVLAKQGPVTKEAVRDFFTGAFFDKLAAKRDGARPIG
jgi:hypothetical protein